MELSYSCIIAVVVHLSTGYITYRDKIPNGHSVPNPCKPEETWSGVGHKLLGGKGARNPFGEDFANNYKTWTKALCEKDSDLDGRSNGLELGDPNCTWSEGKPQPTGHTISHPGICEPWNDPKCLARDQAWVMDVCQPSEFTCDAIKSPGVQNKTLRIPRTVVPAQVTTYMCQIFSLPSDRDYHIIASTPIIDNVDIMHHIVLFGCTEEAQETTFPSPCGMLPSRSCSSVVSIWTPGSAGECMHPEAGFRMGANGFKKVAVQYLELYRGGVKVRDIASDPNYNYDNPQLHTFATTMEVRPGDELRTRCEYSSTKQSRTTRFGPATSNEMCYSFITYYPKANSNRKFWINENTIPRCHLSNDVVEGCHWKNFPDETDPVVIDMFSKITDSCELFGTCTQKCFDAVQSAKEHKCLQGDIWKKLIYKFFRTVQGVEFLMRLQSCDCGVTAVAPSSSSPQDLSQLQSTCDWPGLLALKADHPVLGLYTNITRSCIAIGLCLKECIPAVQEARKHRCFLGDEWVYGRQYLHKSRNGKALEFLLDFESCNCNIKDKQTTSRASAIFGFCTGSVILLMIFIDMGMILT